MNGRKGEIKNYANRTLYYPQNGKLSDVMRKRKIAFYGHVIRTRQNDLQIEYFCKYFGTEQLKRNIQ